MKTNQIHTYVETQGKELNALDNLMGRFITLNMTPMVDDDYPEQRKKYEDALREFLMACVENGRVMECNHSHYNFNTHGRNCSCGTLMVDLGD